MKASAKRSDPVRAILETLVVPALQENNIRHLEGADSFEIEKIDGKWHVDGILECGQRGQPEPSDQSEQLITITAEAIDRERTQLSVDLTVGFSLIDFPFRAMLTGVMIEESPFHMRGGIATMSLRKLTVGLDLVVRADDELLVRQRIEQLVNVGLQLDWYFMLHMPEILDFSLGTSYQDLLPESDCMDEEELLDKELETPAFDRDPLGAMILAHGLGRWEDVLRLLDEYTDEIPAKDRANIEFTALRALGQWRPAIKAAERAGIKDGRFDYELWLNPAYLHCLIEAGSDIEALKLLGAHQDDEPPFYDWLRCIALHRAGDALGAEKAYERYYEACPGDVFAYREHDEMLGEGEDD